METVLRLSFDQGYYCSCYFDSMSVNNECLVLSTEITKESGQWKDIWELYLKYITSIDTNNEYSVGIVTVLSPSEYT